jgi:hypothetical protein
VHVSEHLSFTCLRKASQGKSGPKPESENPTFRGCRGARGNVILFYDTVRAPRLYPDSVQIKHNSVHGRNIGEILSGSVKHLHLVTLLCNCDQFSSRAAFFNEDGEIYECEREPRR